MTEQGALTIVTKIRPGRRDALSRVLQWIVDNDVETNARVPFIRIETIHFARWVIVDPDPDDKSLREKSSYLVFSTNHDLPLDRHLHDLASVAAGGLTEIYSHCEGFPETGQATPEDIVRYLHAYAIPTAAFYIGTRGRSVTQIRSEAKLRDEIEKYLDGNGIDGSGAAVREKIQGFVKGRDDLQWALSPEPAPGEEWHLERRGRIVQLVLLVLAIVVVPFFLMPWWLWLLILLAVIGGLVLTLRLHEIVDAGKDEEDERTMTDALKKRISELANREDHVVQNQLTHIVQIKPGRFRAVTLRVVLWAINLLAAYVFNKGELGGIPSIHFARWVIIDGGRRLLFFSNFDGSWENYLGDFVDKAAGGLTGVWSNTQGFPKTRLLVKEGALDEQHFKTWARYHQIPTQVWYSAYKDLTVQNINNNSAIRADLLTALSPQELPAWLRRL